MSERNVNVRHKQRSDVAANWADANPILLLGELGFESDTGMVKIGDGVQTWNNLPYIKHKISDITDFEHQHAKADITDFPTSMPASDVSAWAKAATKPTYTPSEVGAAPEIHNHDLVYLGKTEKAADSDKLDGVAAADYALKTQISNPNILHNWDFRNPVNQRGVTTTTNTGYFIDRWTRHGAGTVSLISGGVKFDSTSAGNAFFIQRIEYPALYAGATVTISAEVTDVSGAASIRIRSDTVSYSTMTVSNAGLHTRTATLPIDLSTGLEVWFYLGPSSSISVSRIKLEVGTVSTLAYDPPMDYAVELPKCQRFYYRIAALAGGRTFGMSMSASNQGDFNVLINHPVGMRIQPTITHNATVANTLLRAYQGATPHFLDSITNIPNDENASSSIKFYRAGYTGFTVGQFFNIVGAHNYAMGLSADL